MLISTKGRYGVMIMVYLAENYNNGHKPLKEIAASQDLSEKYLEQIINPLTKADVYKRQLDFQRDRWAIQR